MTQEDKQLLLKDLCARLPYGIHLFTNSKHHIRLLTISRDLDYDEQYWINGLYDIDEVKPYLRPMSSMTEEEKIQLSQYACIGEDLNGEFIDEVKRKDCAAYIDWLNAHHFDYRGLIEKGLAIEVTENNNPYGNL